MALYSTNEITLWNSSGYAGQQPATTSPRSSSCALPTDRYAANQKALQPDAASRVPASGYSVFYMTTA